MKNNKVSTITTYTLFSQMIFLLSISSCAGNSNTNDVDGCLVEPSIHLSTITEENRSQELVQQLNNLSGFSGCHRVSISCEPSNLLPENISDKLDFTVSAVTESDVLVADEEDPLFTETDCRDLAIAQVPLELGGEFSSFIRESSVQLKATLFHKQAPEQNDFIAAANATPVNESFKTIRFVFTAVNDSYEGAIYFDNNSNNSAGETNERDSGDSIAGEGGVCAITDWENCL